MIINNIHSYFRFQFYYNNDMKGLLRKRVLPLLILEGDKVDERINIYFVIIVLLIFKCGTINSHHYQHCLFLSIVLIKMTCGVLG